MCVCVFFWLFAVAKNKSSIVIYILNFFFLLLKKVKVKTWMTCSLIKIRQLISFHNFCLINDIVEKNGNICKKMF